MSTEIQTFRIHVPDEVLADLRARLARARVPDALEGAGWSQGTDPGYLRQICAYWRETFDWRAAEAMLNRFDQYRTRIDGLGIHFIHVRSPEPSRSSRRGAIAKATWSGASRRMSCSRIS